jgi:hypothetical protein
MKKKRATLATQPLKSIVSLLHIGKCDQGVQHLRSGEEEDETNISADGEREFRPVKEDQRYTGERDVCDTVDNCLG